MFMKSILLSGLAFGLAMVVGFPAITYAASISNLVVGAQSSPLIYGAGGTATYDVTVDGNSSQKFNWGAAGLPDGVSPTFLPPSVDSRGPWSTVLTLTVSGTVPAGSYPFSVTEDKFDTTGSGTLTVDKADQTITFDALSDKTVGDADFTVAAVSTSLLPVSFGASGECTVEAGLVHLGGVGSCTITATQGGDSNYNAAPEVARTFQVAAQTPSGGGTGGTGDTGGTGGGTGDTGGTGGTGGTGDTGGTQDVSGTGDVSGVGSGAGTQGGANASGRGALIPGSHRRDISSLLGGQPQVLGAFTEKKTDVEQMKERILALMSQLVDLFSHEMADIGA